MLIIWTMRMILTKSGAACKESGERTKSGCDKRLTHIFEGQGRDPLWKAMRDLAWQSAKHENTQWQMADFREDRQAVSIGGGKRNKNGDN